MCKWKRFTCPDFLCQSILVASREVKEETQSAFKQEQQGSHTAGQAVPAPWLPRWPEKFLMQLSRTWGLLGSGTSTAGGTDPRSLPVPSPHRWAPLGSQVFPSHTHLPESSSSTCTALPSLPHSVSCSDASVKSQPCYSLHLHKYLAVLTWDAVKHLYHLSLTPSLPSLCKTGTRLSSVTAECFCTTKYFWARNKQKKFSIIL